MINLLPWKCQGRWRGKTGRRTRWQTRNHDRNEVLRFTLYSNTVLDEMRFLTVDPFVRVFVFIAKLSERWNCWRKLEDLYSQEYIQLFDINCGLFMSLHFSIGCFGLSKDFSTSSKYPFQQNSISFCWSCALTLQSRLQNLFPQASTLMQGGTYFPETRRMLLFGAPLI